MSRVSLANQAKDHLIQEALLKLRQEYVEIARGLHPLTDRIHN